MNTRLILIAVAVLVASNGVLAKGSTYVRGYTKSNGTYVSPHYRRSSESKYSNSSFSTPSTAPSSTEAKPMSTINICKGADGVPIFQQQPCPEK